MSPNELFEIQARVFYLHTGFMAPGKDPGPIPDDRQERMDRWAEFMAVHGEVVHTAIRVTEEHFTGRE